MERLNRKVTYFFYRARKRLASHQSWVVLTHDQARQGRASSHTEPEVVLRSAQLEDIQDILHALPEELVGHLPSDATRAMVDGRFKAEIPCFIAEMGGKIVGGCWCPRFSNLKLLTPLGVRTEGVFEITSLFTMPEYRGRGIATSICQYACNAMYGAGYQQGVSLVWYSRQPSIRAHLKAGFKAIGEKNTYSFMGYRWQQFNNNPAMSWSSDATRLARGGT